MESRMTWIIDQPANESRCPGTCPWIHRGRRDLLKKNKKNGWVASFRPHESTWSIQGPIIHVSSFFFELAFVSPLPRERNACGTRACLGIFKESDSPFYLSKQGKLGRPAMRNLALVVGVWLGTEVVSRLDKSILAWRKRRKKQRRDSRVGDEGRRVAVVTTAAMPWMTGTAVNPTLRATYLAELTDSQVILVVPWLAVCDQKLVFPNDLSFQTPSEQKECIRDWVRKRTGVEPTFEIEFYAGRYDKLLLGIVAVGDAIDTVARLQPDVVILEEPEHINWFHHGSQWTKKFQHVVGVLHTNQVELGRRNSGPFGPLMAVAAFLLTYMLCGMHCHKVIKLSDTLQILPRQTTCFVHAAAPKFLEEGQRKAKRAQAVEVPFCKGAYALGKVVWGKGWEELLTLLEHCKANNSLCSSTAIDCYGDGEAKTTVEARAKRESLPLHFFGKCDHLDVRLQDYKVFVNASTSDVVATTSIEALAMGKWLICADHPCNAFASQFSNTLVYHSPEEFCEHLQYALDNDPHPLDHDTSRELGWKAATERFLAAAEIQPQKWPSVPAQLASSFVWNIYRTFTGIEAVRLLVGAGANTRRTPLRVTDYDPSLTTKPASHSVWRAVSLLLPDAITAGGAGWVVGSESDERLGLELASERQLFAN